MYKTITMRVVLIFIAAFCLYSCSGQQEQKDAVSASSMPVEHTAAVNGYTQKDPVCEMARDSTWNDYTVYNNDTIWFCSEGCKKAFLARPQKYVKIVQ